MTPQPSPTSTSIERKIQYLTVLTWTCSIMFGLYAAIHYVYPALFKNNWDGWDATDFGLYRRQHARPNCGGPNNSVIHSTTTTIDNRDSSSSTNTSTSTNENSGCITPNIIMLTHLIGGVYLMIAGPIQLIPYIRRQYINIHRWVGRLYIIAAIIASSCALAFCLSYGNARHNPHENVGNTILGISAFVCAVQSYKHIKEHIKEQQKEGGEEDRYNNNNNNEKYDLNHNHLEQHKFWSYRLYAVILGAVLYRLYAAFYYGLLLLLPPSILPYNNHINNLIFYLMAIPNLIVVELIWRNKLNPKQKSCLNTSLLMICIIFLFITGTSISILFWIPSIFGSQNISQTIPQDAATGNDKNVVVCDLCQFVSIVKVIGVFILLFIISTKHFDSCVRYLIERLQNILHYEDDCTSWWWKTSTRGRATNDRVGGGDVEDGVQEQTSLIRTSN